MKIETTTSARFELRADDSPAFDAGSAFVSQAARRANVRISKQLHPTAGLTGTARSAAVTLTCDDAEYLIKFCNDLKQALQLINCTPAAPRD